MKTTAFFLPDLLYRLRRNQLDLLYFDDNPITENDLVKVLEKKDGFSVVCASDHPLAGKSCTLKELVGEPFILTEKGISYRDPFDRLLAAEGLTLLPFLEAGNTDLIIELLKGSRYLSLLPTFTVRTHPANKEH